MALSFTPVAVEDNGRRKWKELADYAASQNPLKQQTQQTKPAATQTTAKSAAVEDPRSKMQQTYKTASGTKTTPAANTYTYTAPRKQEEEEEKPKTSAGNMTAPAHKQYRASDVEKELGIQQEEERPAAAPKTTAAVTPVEPAAVQTVAEATETETKPARRSGEYRAEAQAPMVYTGGETAGKTAGTGTAAQTKSALTSEEEEPDWMKDLRIANAEDQRRRQAVANANQELAIAAMNLKQQPDQGTIQRLNYEARQQISQPERERRQAVVAQNQQRQAQQQANNPQYLAEEGFSWAGNPSMSADRTTTGGGETFMDPDIQEAYERSVQAWIDYGLPKEEAEANAKRALADQMKTTVSELPKPVQRYGEIRAEAQAPAAPTQTTATTRTTTEPTIEDLAKQYGISQGTLQDPDFQKILQNMKAQGMTNSAALSNSYAQFQGTRQDEKRQLVYDLEEKYLDEAGLDYSDLGNAEADALHARAVKEAEEAFKEPTYRYTGEQRAEKQAPQFTWPTFGGKAANTSTTPTTGGTNNRLGAAAEVASWDQNQGWIRQNEKEGGVIDESTKPRPDKNGNATTNAAGNPVTTGSTQSTTQNSTDKSSNPKGTQYLTPSYGQGGKVVKLPYKTGGYSESELIAAGNNPRGEKYGSNVYEGYYKAPDGNYYPVDQEKAAYYLRNGYSYEGWEEPMRDYYNTFGTFYGYRKDWKSAGKSTGGGYSYSPRSYSYSTGGGSSRSSYGRGSTPNNGMYWNGLTSWNA